MTSLGIALAIIGVVVGGLLVVAFIGAYAHIILNAGLFLLGVALILAGIAANSVGGGISVVIGLVFALVGGFNLKNIIEDKEY